jgi:hypothetical protein
MYRSFEPESATKASNPKHKREVCRYWLQSRCIKGQACEFLHAIDHDKMPVCAYGDECPNADCAFKHLPDDRPVCANYAAGFCSFGRRCAHKHLQLPPEQMPAVAAYWTEAYHAHEYARRRSTEPNWRRKHCDYFKANGWCPYFDMCNFQH